MGMRDYEKCGVTSSIVNGRKVITLKGIRFFEDKILGRGSNGTVVYEGESVFFIYQGIDSVFIPAAVKCFSKEQFYIQEKGILNQYQVKRSLNINSLFRIEEANGFFYVSMDLCEYDLRCLVQEDNLYAGLLKENGHPSHRLLQLIKDIVTGLNNLHSVGIIHGNLEPSHVLIVRDMNLHRAELSGMGSCRRLDAKKKMLERNDTISGSIGWQSPEQILKLPQTPAMDMFTLGCVLFFILTKGKHPFGDLPERETNVVNNNIVNLSMIEHIPVFKDLLIRLLRFEPELRPNASEVLGHPLFWDNLKRIRFLIESGERADSNDEKGRSIAESLEKKRDVVFSETTFEDDAFISQMDKGRLYTFLKGKVHGLLRIIYLTSLRSQGKDLPTKVKELLGRMPEGLDNYICCTFPNLLAVVYDVMYIHCKNERWFHSHYLEDDTGPMVVRDHMNPM